MKTTIFAALLFASTCIAQDANRDARMANIAAELRCLVCQNQSLADSHADLAVDLRRQIGEQIDEGRSDEEIRAYMVARYGDFVLYRPPFKASTLVLWFAPALLLVLGLGFLLKHLRSRSQVAPAMLREDERIRAAALLDDRPAE